MKHDKYGLYMVSIVAVVGLVAIILMVGAGDVTGQAFGKFQFGDLGKFEYGDNTETVDINGKFLIVGETVNVETIDGKVLIGIVTDQGVVVNGISVKGSWKVEQGSDILVINSYSGKFI